MLKCLTAYLKIFRKRECRKNMENDFSAQKSRRNLHFRVCHTRYKFQKKIFRINYLKRGRNIFEKHVLRSWKAWETKNFKNCAPYLQQDCEKMQR